MVQVNFEILDCDAHLIFKIFQLKICFFFVFSGKKLMQIVSA